MSISVVIPAYNEEEFIGQVLTSLSKQTVKPHEIIVVDNNCHDKTVEIAKTFNVKVVREEKQGMIYARNKGFDSAHSDIIARTDADSFLPPFWVERILADFEKNDEIVALSGPATMQVPGSHQVIQFMCMVNKFFVGHYLLYGPNMAIKKKVWEKMRNTVCLDGSKVHEDFDLGLHIGEYGKIYYDEGLNVTTSARRLKNLQSFMIEYPSRWFRTLSTHKKLFNRKYH